MSKPERACNNCGVKVHNVDMDGWCRDCVDAIIGEMPMGNVTLTKRIITLEKRVDELESRKEKNDV